MDTPEYLFRTYSDESTGLNTPTLFKPYIYTSGSKTSIKDVIKSSEKMAYCLEQGLKWQDGNIDTPLINWTDSFLFALLFALYKRHPKPGNPKRSEEHNIHIICLKTSTATDIKYRPAVFTKTSELMEVYSVSLRNTYDDEFATVDSVRPGTGSFVLSLSTLLANGLYKLHPALHTAFQRPDPRWRLALVDFRNFWFGNEARLTAEHIHLVCQLAGTAVDINGNLAVATPFLAAFLGLEKRAGNDVQLLEWLGQYSECGVRSKAKSSIGLIRDDVDQICAILRLLETRQITHMTSPHSIDIRNAATKGEVEAWEAFQRARKAARWKDFASRPDRLHRCPRGERTSSFLNRELRTSGPFEGAHRERGSRRGRRGENRRQDKVYRRRFRG